MIKNSNIINKYKKNNVIHLLIVILTTFSFFEVWPGSKNKYKQSKSPNKNNVNKSETGRNTEEVEVIKQDPTEPKVEVQGQEPEVEEVEVIKQEPTVPEVKEKLVAQWVNELRTERVLGEEIDGFKISYVSHIDP
jgi:hypothetical protein